MDIKSVFQLIAAILFIAIGTYIGLNEFPDNRILIGNTRFLFAGVLFLYGIIRIHRVYRAWKINKDNNYEDPDH